MASLAEACTIIRRLWTDDGPFDFDGDHHHLEGAFSRPQPVQRPGPPIVIGGRSTATLRVVAQHADIWNIPGGDIADASARSAMLDRFCADLGRDPGAITRSIFLPVLWDHPQTTRDAVSEALEAGFTHLVLGLPTPYVDGVVHRVATEIIGAHTA